MPTEFDREKCNQRNRIAALRHGINSAHFDFFRQRDADEELSRLPKGEDGIMSAINALRPSGEPLSFDDIWVHYAEAASTNFIGDRFMFLSESTLRNIATDAAGGVAFMNSHRTGGLSAECTLPMGKTFAGRYESGEGKSRAVVGLYMLKNSFPNGASGPGTDDIHRLISSGVFSDVSVGLHGGEAICDVCGKSMEYFADEYCSHVPGTTYEMSEEEKRTQKKRGVPDGKCSMTYRDARMGEISAVYEGAVPEAGFVSLSARTAPVFNGIVRGSGARKASLLARTAKLPDNVIGEMRDAFAGIAFPGILDEGAPDTSSFIEQLDKTLADVDACLQRAKSIQELRGKQGRALSPDRLGRIRELGRMLSEMANIAEAPDRERVFRELQERALKLRA